MTRPMIWPPPTAAEIAEVEAGVNDRLVAAEAEIRDEDRGVASAQDLRDSWAAAGFFDQATDLDRAIQDAINPADLDPADLDMEA